MDQTTDARQEERSVRNFYDSLAEDYDTMTGFEKRFVVERPFFRMIVEKYRIQSALDAGSGTGFHSLLLAQLGVNVTAVDVSPEMLRRVEAHARLLDLNVKTVLSSFQTIGKSVVGPFDALFCLGNSLAHVLTTGELHQTLRAFASLLKPKGILLLQNLNYDRILAHREKIQNVKETEEKTFIRSYDYEEDRIIFNILTSLNDQGSAGQQLQTIPLRPLKHQELVSSVESTGFVEVRSFGSISMGPFVPLTSKDLVVLARRSSTGQGT